MKKIILFVLLMIIGIVFGFVVGYFLCFVDEFVVMFDEMFDVELIYIEVVLVLVGEENKNVEYVKLSN